MELINSRLIIIGRCSFHHLIYILCRLTLLLLISRTWDYHLPWVTATMPTTTSPTDNQIQPAPMSSVGQQDASSSHTHFVAMLHQQTVDINLSSIIEIDTLWVYVVTSATHMLHACRQTRISVMLFALSDLFTGGQVSARAYACISLNESKR